MKIVFLGLSITSSWGNGHATTYRGLVKQLNGLGHEVIFLEREQPWYADNRDLSDCSYCQVGLYEDLSELIFRYEPVIADAEVVVLGSFVPDGVAVADWLRSVSNGVLAFYDIDTPVTLGKLMKGDYEYLAPRIIPCFDLYLSFTGGPTLELLESTYGAQRAAALYCSVDPAEYRPLRGHHYWDLGYLGTYSADRQPALQRLMLDVQDNPAPRLAVAGSMYPKTIEWPQSVTRLEHLPPGEHAAFYGRQRFTLNITRAAMVKAGYSPSIRLFEAAATGTPIISDVWPGLEHFFTPGREILLASDADDVARYLREIPEIKRLAIAHAAHERVLREHTALHRARCLERFVRETACEKGLKVPSPL